MCLVGPGRSSPRRDAQQDQDEREDIHALLGPGRLIKDERRDQHEQEKTVRRAIWRIGAWLRSIGLVIGSPAVSQRFVLVHIPSLLRSGAPGPHATLIALRLVVNHISAACARTTRNSAFLP
jgi:hypothetical protein